MSPGKTLVPITMILSMSRVFQISYLKILVQLPSEMFNTLKDTQKKSFWGLWK